MPSKLKAATMVEQNANTLAGIQYDSTIYATAATGGVTIKSGREAPVYVLTGVQTASNVQVVLDRANAGAGDTFLIKRGTAAVTGTSVITVYDNAASGTAVGILGTAAGAGGAALECTVTFNGTAWAG